MNQLRIDGLAELREALRALPTELAEEGAVMVETQAEAAFHAMAREYPIRDYGARAGRGNLRNHLKLDPIRGDARSGTSARIVNTARHAWIFEHGTGPRRWANGKSTGSMPPGKVFIPIAIRYRRLLESALRELVTRAGLTVSGE